MSHVHVDRHADPHADPYCGALRFSSTRALSATRRLVGAAVTGAPEARGAAERVAVLRAGQTPQPRPMVMTAAFGGRTYTRPGSGTPSPARSW